MSKTRIISILGTISGDLNDEHNLFREIRQTMLQHFFSKEWNEYQKTLQNYNKECQRNIELEETCQKLLSEINPLKVKKSEENS